MGKYGKARQSADVNIIRRMITKTVDTHTEYVTLIVFLIATAVTCTRLSVRLYIGTFPGLLILYMGGILLKRLKVVWA